MHAEEVLENEKRRMENNKKIEEKAQTLVVELKFLKSTFAEGLNAVGSLLKSRDLAIQVGTRETLSFSAFGLVLDMLPCKLVRWSVNTWTNSARGNETK